MAASVHLQVAVSIFISLRLGLTQHIITTSNDTDLSNTTIECDSDTSCIVTCDSTSGCAYSTINCPSNHACNIYCSAFLACQETIINLPSTSTQYSIVCDDQFACFYATFNWPLIGPKAAALSCLAFQACAGTNIVAPDDTEFMFSCSYTLACNSATIECSAAHACAIVCDADFSCSSAVIACPQSAHCYVDGSAASALSAATVVCPIPNSAANMCEIECNATATACTNLVVNNPPTIGAATTTKRPTIVATTRPSMDNNTRVTAIKSTLREAMVDEYGDVESKMDLEQTWPTQTPHAQFDVVVVTTVSAVSGAFLCCIFVVAVVYRYIRRRRADVHQVQPTENVIQKQQEQPQEQGRVPQPGQEVEMTEVVRDELVREDEEEKQNNDEEAVLQQIDGGANMNPEGLRASVVVEAAAGDESDSEQLYDVQQNETTTGAEPAAQRNLDDDQGDEDSEDMYVVDLPQTTTTTDSAICGQKQNASTVFM